MARVEPEKNRGGDWVRFGDEEYRVPPLAFRALQELAPRVEALKAMGAVPTTEQMETVEMLVHSALLRNYPQMTLAEVSDMLDIGNYIDVLSAALAISGFKLGGGGSTASGEPLASIGAASTAP